MAKKRCAQELWSFLEKMVFTFFIAMTNRTTSVRAACETGYGRTRGSPQAAIIISGIFSAFAVEDKKQRDELEAILIAAMPTANSARPKLQKEKMPNEVAQLLHEIYAHNKA
jgi:hypothetical protein